MSVQPPDNTNRARYYDYGNSGSYGEYENQPPLYAAPADTLRRATPRKRHRGRVWLIVIVVLAALLVAADRVAAAVTENQLAAKIQTSQHLSQKPGVSISGFPFLTQVVSRNFGHATVDIDNFVSDGVTISHIHADLRGVHVSSGYNSATVDTLNGTATLTYDAISQVLSSGVANIGHITVSQGTGNQVVASYSLLGVKLTADVAVSLLNGNTLEFRTTKVHTSVSGLGINAPGFDSKIQLNALPFGMQLSSLQMTSTGVNISATGRNVLLTRNTTGTTGTG